nr:hypothetical protein Iba_chr06dCG5570 [Ipomoea batatas]
MIEGCVNEATMAQWEEMGELFIEDEDIEEPCTEEAEIEELYATNDPIGEEPPPKMTRNKSIAKKPAPKVPQESKTEIDRDILLSLFKDMRATLGPVGNTRKRARRGAAAQAQQRVEVEEENEEGQENEEDQEEEMRAMPETWLRGQFPPGPQYYYDPAGGPPHYYDPTGGPPHFYSSAGGSQPYYGAAGGSQYYFDPAEGSQPQYDPSRGPQFPYDPTDF